MKKKLVAWLSLFTSAGTLVCCALPALFVAMGMGATFAGLASSFPQIIWISEHKIAVFAIAGALLIIAGVMQWRARNLACPTDPALAAACQTGRDISAVVFWIAVVCYSVGAFFAFLAPLLF